MPTQTIAQLEGRAEELLGLMEKIHAYEEVTEEAQVRFDEYAGEYSTVAKDLGSARRESQLESAKLRALAGDQKVEVRGDKPGDLDADPIGEPESSRSSFRGRDPWNLDEMRTFGQDRESVSAELRSRALSAVDHIIGAKDSTRAVIADLLEEHPALARQMLLTSSPTYTRAFAKLAKNPLAQLSPEEARAMSLTDGEGGYMVPFQIDPAVILLDDGSYNQIRQAARVVQATGDVWNGVAASGGTWSWDGEAVEVSDDTATWTQPSVSLFKAQSWVPISLEAYDDEANVTGEVAKIMAFEKDNLESAAFATGTGSGQPTGIVTALTGGASVVASATTDTFAVADVYALDTALPARHRGRASWLAARGTYNLIRAFDTGGSGAMWERLGADVPPLLLGRNAYEAEAMDSSVTGSADNLMLVYGDFGSSYVIADRIGFRVELVPTVFNTANNRPSGQRGWHGWYRVGADSVNDGAFAMLNVT